MPRSLHADEFNHDEDASEYDRDVRNEEDPIRTGYEALLDWVAREARLGAGSRVLELGSGTGNLTQRLTGDGEIVCVDVSKEMMRIATAKLEGRANIGWQEHDLLEYFDEPGPPFDGIVSSYAIHHLTEDEKHVLFGHVAARLTPGGRIAFGDLMFESAVAREEILATYRATGRAELAGEVCEEFFWDVGEALRGLGFDVAVKRFSELSWGIAGRLAVPG